LRRRMLCRLASSCPEDSLFIYEGQGLLCASCRRHRFENHRPEIHPSRLPLRLLPGQVRQRQPREVTTSRPPMSRRKPLPTTHRLVLGPDFANSTRLHSAPFQRRPVKHSTGPRFHSAPFHRLKSSKTGRPRRCESESFRKVPSAGKPRIRAFAKLPHSHRPQNQPDLCHPGKPLALRLPASPQATARVSPGWQKSGHRVPACPSSIPPCPPYSRCLSAPFLRTPSPHRLLLACPTPSRL